MKKVLSLSLFALLVLSLIACQKKAEVKKSGRYGGAVKVAFRSDIPSLDPALSYDTESWAACFMLYDGLVGYGDSTEIVPAIAESWLISDDGKKYTFTLRQGVKFTNGREVEAGDFKYAIERVLEPKTRSYGSAFFTNLVGAKEFVDGKAHEVKGLADNRRNLMHDNRKQILEAGLRGEEVFLKGIVVPGDTDERLTMVSIVLSTDQELDFVIERNAKGDELFDHLRELVRVKGFIREDQPEKRMIRITAYKVLDRNAEIRT